MKTKKNIMEILKHVYLLIITFIVLTPIYYLLVTTFKSGTEAAAKPMALPSFWDERNPWGAEFHRSILPPLHKSRRWTWQLSHQRSRNDRKHRNTGIDELGRT